MEKKQSRCCPECSSIELTTDNKGEVACKVCGLVIDEKIDLGKDYAQGSEGEDKERRHGPPGRYLNGGNIGSTF
jgi:transcription initiation factor TFIIIB Brf1 subunit/transcription initiation factor TFIIB